MPASNFRAGGNINPSTFVKVSTAADNTVLAATAGDWVIGIANPSTKLPPISGNSTVAAAAGDNVAVFGLGDICNLVAGTAVTRGDKLKSDANGKGVTTTTGGEFIGAVALESGASGELIRVQIVIGSI